ncbi:DUF1853 family protein [Halomonas denitrificans]|nr:DUF1853 family protein [Halomonas denitrificans]
MPLPHPIQRDLHWLLTSPLLVTCPPYANNDFLAQFATPLLPRLAALSHNCQSPLWQLRPGDRLGHYYEQLWRLAIELHPDYELLAHNLLVKQGKRVIGSADFVVHHQPSRTLEHWEVAVKFYLGRGPELTDWIGPGKQDRLADKLTRFEQHQLPLLKRSEGLLLMQDRGWEINTQRVLLQGRLYHPGANDVAPAPIDSLAPRGRWYHHHALPQGHYRSLHRSDWLAGRDWHLLPRFDPYPPLTWPRHLLSADSGERLFVVPDNW